MKIFITKTFKNIFLKEFNFNSILLDFIKILSEKNHNLIDLKYPYKKFKYNMWNLTIRGIIFCWIENILIPLFIVKKSDKKYWNNLILNWNIEKILEDRLIKTKIDLEDNNFEKYETLKSKNW